MDANKQNEDYEFVWGIKSPDDCTGMECGLCTMNDFTLIFNKRQGCYQYDVETIYEFQSHDAHIRYYASLLAAFRKWMEASGHRTNVPMLSKGQNNHNLGSIEEAYTHFAFHVQCLRQNILPTE